MGTCLQRELRAPALLCLHRLADSEELDGRIAVLANRPVRTLVVAEDVGGGPFDGPRLLVTARLCDGIAERLR